LEDARAQDSPAREASSLGRICVDLHAMGVAFGSATYGI
jgi:hypothetical protein